MQSGRGTSKASKKPRQQGRKKPPRYDPPRRIWLLVLGGAALTVGAGAAMLGIALLGSAVSWWLAVPVVLLLLVVYTVAIALLSGEAGCYAGIGILLLTVLGTAACGVGWNDLQLQLRGERVEAVVTGKRMESHGKAGPTWYFRLERADGKGPVPGGEFRPEDGDVYKVGQHVTVLADPDGEASPNTPGHAELSGELVGWLGSTAVIGVLVGWPIATEERKRRRAARQHQEWRAMKDGGAVT